MLNVYSNIPHQTGRYIAGIYKILIAPRQWLQAQAEISFNSGRIIGIPDLEIGRIYLELDFIPGTYELDEKPKDSKNGPFYVTSLEGTINEISPALLMAMETYRYHEFVAVAYDKLNRIKLIGNKDAGLILKFEVKETDDRGGNKNVSISLNMECERTAPYISS